MFEIIIPIAPGTPYDLVQKLCMNYECTIKKTKNDGYYKITTEKVVNLFWLGMNFQNFIDKYSKS